MSTTNYAYEYAFDWSMTTKSSDYVNLNMIPTVDEDALKTETAGKMNAQAETTFLEKMSQSGHWYAVDAVMTEVTSIQRKVLTSGGGGVYGRLYTLQVTILGRTHIKFTTDIADPNVPSSPALVLILAELGLAIVTALIAHPWILIGFLMFLAITYVGGQFFKILTDGTTQLLKTFQETFGDLSGIVAIAVITVVGVLGYVFLTGGGIETFKGRKGRKRSRQ